MALAIAQWFPLGRFHATRWNQNPFEDPYGEWPPSPWRLLRALAARWFQYSRETADCDAQLRDNLLKSMSSTLPMFRIPETTWRGVALRQYQPTGLEDQYKYKKQAGTNKKVLDYSYKEVSKSLVEDHYRAVPNNDSLIWLWDSLTLPVQQTILLKELLRRVLYFGRAESFCRFDLAESTSVEPNCYLSPERGVGPPVLVALPNPDIKVLLAATDDELIARRRIPPGTAWYYASIPPCPRISVRPSPRPQVRSALTIVQFAVGGRVYPPPSRWVKVIERFRGQVLRSLAQQMTGNPKASYRDLSTEDRDRLSLMCGKDGQGRPLCQNEHAYFSFWPDQSGLPTRLVCWRDTPFTESEVEALLAASEHIYSWEYGKSDWKLRLVPLPFETPPPPGFDSESDCWISITPFVPPANRRRFRQNGRIRPGETPECLVAKLLVKCGYPAPEHVELLNGPAAQEWVVVHATRRERTQMRRNVTSKSLPGFRLRVLFREPVQGPIALGDSAHFGLGLFAPERPDKSRPLEFTPG